MKGEKAVACVCGSFFCAMDTVWRGFCYISRGAGSYQSCTADVFPSDRALCRRSPCARRMFLSGIRFLVYWTESLKGEVRK